MFKMLFFDFIKHGLATFYFAFNLWKFAPHINAGEFFVSLGGFIIIQMIAQTILVFEIIYEKEDNKEDDRI